MSKHDNDFQRQVYEAAESRDVNIKANGPKVTVQVTVKEKKAYRLGLGVATWEAHIAAFGAIRRAAEVAREEDRRVIEYREIYHDPIISAASEVIASGIRRAIRAAMQGDQP